MLKSTVVLPFNRASLWWDSRHSLQTPTLRLYWYSPSPAGQLTELEQVLVSVRLGQVAPPYIGVARTCRIRCCRPAPQVLLQLDQEVKTETIQSCGQGMRHACSTGGFWEKNSHICEDTFVWFEVRTQWTLRLWIPCCAVMHSAVLSVWSLPKKGSRKQFSQSDTSHLKRSWCQLQTFKHCRRLSGLSTCLQCVWCVVQPSMWTHHISLIWTPPEPHSSPIQWPHWPETMKERERERQRQQDSTFLNEICSLSKHKTLNCSLTVAYNQENLKTIHETTCECFQSEVVKKLKKTMRGNQF